MSDRNYCEDDSCPFFDHNLCCCMRYNPDTDKCACEEGYDDE